LGAVNFFTLFKFSLFGVVPGRSFWLDFGLFFLLIKNKTKLEIL